MKLSFCKGKKREEDRALLRPKIQTAQGWTSVDKKNLLFRREVWICLKCVHYNCCFAQYEKSGGSELTNPINRFERYFLTLSHEYEIPRALPCLCFEYTIFLRFILTNAVASIFFNGLNNVWFVSSLTLKLNFLNATATLLRFSVVFSVRAFIDLVVGVAAKKYISFFIHECLLLQI